MKYIGIYSNDANIATKKNVDAKQDKVLVDGILKGDGNGAISAAVADTDYATCTNLVNGDVDGSLRTINSTMPSSSYTMGQNAFAEGSNTNATGVASHAEGASTTAVGAQSHAEGSRCYAGGNASHVEGFSTRVEVGARYAHAEGFSTKANHRGQHVQGEYNIPDDSTAAATSKGNYVHIVGNGTAAANSNAHTLDWSGNAWFAGNVYVGSTSGTNKDDGSKKLATTEDVESRVPTTRTVNGKALSADISLTATDVGAMPSYTEIPKAATIAPKMNGATSVGSNTGFSRGDHVHPTDTSRADTTLSNLDTTQSVSGLDQYEMTNGYAYTSVIRNGVPCAVIATSNSKITLYKKNSSGQLSWSESLTLEVAGNLLATNEAGTKLYIAPYPGTSSTQAYDFIMMVDMTATTLSATKIKLVNTAVVYDMKRIDNDRIMLACDANTVYIINTVNNSLSKSSITGGTLATVWKTIGYIPNTTFSLAIFADGLSLMSNDNGATFNIGIGDSRLTNTDNPVVGYATSNTNNEPYAIILTKNGNCYISQNNVVWAEMAGLYAEGVDRTFTDIIYTRGPNDTDNGIFVLSGDTIDSQIYYRFGDGLTGYKNSSNDWESIDSGSIGTNAYQVYSLEKFNEAIATDASFNRILIAYNGGAIENLKNRGVVTNSTAANLLNRGTAVNVNDVNYTTYMARGIALTSDTSVQPTVDGTIVLYYEA